ncbi:hypothetical protein D3C77_420210 [compost metagenome]
MPTMSFEIPDDLLIAISNKAQADQSDFVTATLDLIKAGLADQAKAPSGKAAADALLQKLIRCAAVFEAETVFTTQDLVSKSDWELVDANSRKSIGQAFSKAVSAKQIPGVEATGSKTPQNKSIYIRR